MRPPAPDGGPYAEYQRGARIVVKVGTSMLIRQRTAEYPPHRAASPHDQRFARTAGSRWCWSPRARVTVGASKLGLAERLVELAMSARRRSGRPVRADAFYDKMFLEYGIKASRRSCSRRENIIDDDQRENIHNTFHISDAHGRGADRQRKRHSRHRRLKHAENFGDNDTLSRSSARREADLLVIFSTSTGCTTPAGAKTRRPS